MPPRFGWVRSDQQLGPQTWSRPRHDGVHVPENFEPTCAAAQARIAAVGRDASRLGDVEATLRIAADTTTPEGAALALAACQDAFGAAPTLLAHCVGSTLIAPLHRTRTESYREVMRVNLDSAAATYASQGVRVNAVAPGMTETPMTAGMLKMPAMREGAARQYPLGGVQSAGQVADVMAWLLGDGSARLTGQVLAVDGGFTTVRPLVK